MTKLIIPLMAALLFTVSCCPNNKCCPNRYCPPTAPTHPVCPKPCTKAKPCASPSTPKCGCRKKAVRKACPQHREARTDSEKVTLSEVMDFMPGLPPGYFSI